MSWLSGINYVNWLCQGQGLSDMELQVVHSLIFRENKKEQ